MNNSQVAAKFAAGATSGKGSNLFIDGDTIYSYGHHFPIATRTRAGVLLNPRRYSMSTGRHQSYVRQALWRAGIEPILASENYGPGTRLVKPAAAEVKARAKARAEAEAREVKRQERRAAREAARLEAEAKAEREAPPTWVRSEVEPIVAPLNPAQEVR